jgi:hypothetical protein
MTGCGGSGYEFGDDVLKFPSASRGNPAAAGFADAFSSGLSLSHSPAPSSYRYRMLWHYIQNRTLCPRTRLRAKRCPEELTVLIPSYIPLYIPGGLFMVINPCSYPDLLT